MSSLLSSLVPYSTAFEILRRVNLLNECQAFALDIGGTLAKLVYVQPFDSPPLIIDRLHIPKTNQASRRGLSVRREDLNGTLHFFVVETKQVGECIRFLERHWGSLKRGKHVGCMNEEQRAEKGNGYVGSNSSDDGGADDEACVVRATGGGAYKYAKLFRELIGVRLVHVDEMASVVAGLNYFLVNGEREVYRFDPPSSNGAHDSSGSWRKSGAKEVGVGDRAARRTWVPKNGDPFPYLLVNIGTGVSILKVTGHDEFERISGSSLGGGTFWGLARLLLNCKTFDEVIALTNKDMADNANVDMMVGDIYGRDYAKLGLGGDVIAASFGKVTMKKDHGTRPSLGAAWKGFIRFLKGTWFLWLNFWFAVPVIGSILAWLGIERKSHWSLANMALSSHFHAQDVALSLLRMVSYNIGQIAYLNARRYDLSTIYFAGNFIQDHPYTMAAISFAVDFWSKGATQALFLRHDGYLGAVGAYLNGTSKRRPSVKKQWHEDSLRKTRNVARGANGSAVVSDMPSQPTQTPRKNKKKRSKEGQTANRSPERNGADQQRQAARTGKGQRDEAKSNLSSGGTAEKAAPLDGLPADVLLNDEFDALMASDRGDPPSPPWVEVTRTKPRKRKTQKNQQESA